MMKTWKELREPALRVAGFFLAISHLVVFYRWYGDAEFAKQTLSDSFALCWPFFSDCSLYRNTLLQFLNPILFLYAFLALVTAILFLKERFCEHWAPLLLLSTTLLKALVFVADYRFMGNYHYMIWWFTLVYLFFPQKRLLLPLSLVLFYFFAGLLKLNEEWLSGAALIRKPVVEGILLSWLLKYVIVLELVLVPLLFFFKNRYRWFLLVQLLAFHIFSIHIVSYLYPALMFCLLVILLFPLPEKRILPKAGIALLASFSLFQSLPVLIPGDASLTGEGRFFSLNMLDAKLSCVSSLEQKHGSEWRAYSDALPFLETRIRCDPYTAYRKALTRCEGAGDSIFRFYAKKSTENTYTQLVNIENFCQTPPTYSYLTKNSWIKAQALPLQEEKTFDSILAVFSPTKIETKSLAEKNWSYSFADTMRVFFFPSRSGILAVSSEQRVYNLDPNSGKALWLVPFSGYLTHTPYLSGNENVFLFSLSHELKPVVTAIDRKKGQVLFAYTLPVAPHKVYPPKEDSIEMSTLTGSKYRLQVSGWELLP